MPRIGIVDVATLAGVSTTTVSHVLSGRRPVAAGTRRRVLKVVEELGYRPAGQARSLRTGRTMTVALVVPDLTNPFYPVVARGLEDRLLPAGYHAVVANTDGRHEEERSVLEQMVARGVDGMVVSAFCLTPEDLARYADVPVVQLGGRIDTDSTDRVRSDDEGGTAAAVRHLFERGYRSIAYVAGPGGAGVSVRREAGFRAAMAEAGLPLEESLLIHGEFTRDAGRHAAAHLFDRQPAPRAVVCANDLVAIGVMDVARARGLSIPADVAVTGYDDIDAASLVTPALTTVVNPGRDIGHACADLLLDRMNGHAGPSRQVVLSTALTVRDST